MYSTHVRALTCVELIMGGADMNIGFREDLYNEFKSDLKKLSDEVIIESVVAFSNADGRNFYLGVEDDGEITGLHPAHKNSS